MILAAAFAAWALLWIWLVVLAVRRDNWRAVGHCLAYHGLLAGAFVMILPFYWMLSTSLKDFEGASSSTPSWAPAATRFYAPAPDAGGEIEVKLVRDLDEPLDEVRKKDAVLVAEYVERQGPRRGDAPAPQAFEIPGSALRVERRPQWRNYAEAWNSPAKGTPEKSVTFTRYFQVSLVTALVTTLGTLFTSVLAAYAFAKMRFRGKSLLFYLVLATMMVPGQVLLIPNFLILARLPDFTFGMRWLDNYPALIAPWLASVFSIFLLRQFFMGVPDDLWDAAQIDGAGRLRYLGQVLLPLSRPALVTAGLFIFLGQWNSLLWPLIVTTRPEMRTLMVGLQTLNDELRTDYHLLMAASAISIAPVVVLFFFLQRFFIQGIARTGIK